MARRRASSLLIGIGLLVALSGYVALVVRATILNGEAVTASAREALDEPGVRALLVERTTDALVAAPAPFPADRAGLAPVAERLVDDPAFAAAYERAATQLHARMLLDPTIVPTIELTGLVAAVRAEYAVTDPATAARLAPVTTLAVALPVDGAPHLRAVDHELAPGRAIAAVIAGIALVLASIAVAAPGARWRPLRAVAGAVGALGLAQLAGAFVAHLLIDGSSGAAAPLVAAVFDPVLGRVALHGLPPFAVGVLAGVAARQLRRRPLVRHADDGRAAFLTDEHGNPTEWSFDTGYEPEALRTAPSTAAYGR